MPPSYGDVARRLAYSGVEVRRLHQALTIEVETYQVTDKRAGNTFYEGHIRNAVTTEVVAKPLTLAAGSYVYTMTQPNANIVAVALEPESPSSFVTFGIIPVDRKGAGGASSEVPVYRLMQPVALDARLIERD
jgi:tRNA(Ile2) C34 agmatinyltransferase TiaS